MLLEELAPIYVNSHFAGVCPGSSPSAIFAVCCSRHALLGRIPTHVQSLRIAGLQVVS